MTRKNPKTFEEQLKRLDEIVETLDSTEIPLDKQLLQFEEGMELVSSLREFLNNAEQKVVEITRRSRSNIEEN